MKLPFTEEQFLGVFSAYNDTLWLAVIALWLLSLAVVIGWLRGKGRSERLVPWLLAMQWAWAAIAYHLAFFASINPAARLFAAMFVVQAILFARHATAPARHPLSVRTTSRFRKLTGVGLTLYALGYPALVVLVGFEYPAMPTFGVPCPVTLLTAGMLIASSPPVPRSMLVVPVLWSLVGGSAAVMFGVTPDGMLLVAAALLVVDFVRPRLSAE